MGFKLKSELSEKQIEADVATFLGWVTPIGSSFPFRLLDIDEQIYGADKKFDLVIPIYMQFKVSHGLTTVSNPLLPKTQLFSHLTFPFNLKPLQRIRHFRYRENLYDNPTLYFKLRAQAETADDFQHNILMRFTNTEGTSHAFYVSPLTLYKTDYEKMLYDSCNRYLSFPFYYSDLTIFQEKWTSHLGLIPFLRAHISIIPHEHVTTDKHYYSFSPNGTEVAWHSPKFLTEKALRLSDRFRDIFSRALSNLNQWKTPEEYLSILVADKIINFSEMNNLNNLDISPVERLVNFGRELYKQHEIRQLLLLTKKEVLNDIISRYK